MAAQTVIRMGHPTLRKTADHISEGEFHTQEFKSLLVDLYDTMKKEGGIGIAAPQINISKSVALIELPEFSERYGQLPVTGLITIINPQIEFLTDDKQGFWEGCLSVPGLRGFVERPNKIRVQFQDENYQLRSLEVEGFLATVFQHELDHLFGKLFIDRLKDPSMLSYLAEFDQFIAPPKAENESNNDDLLD
ncbi:MAG: peptide deformylase [Bacteriovoracaceae bacterium]|nr:peptide deformylase [Bacteriovoracaceae bacterium]